MSRYMSSAQDGSAHYNHPMPLVHFHSFLFRLESLIVLLIVAFLSAGRKCRSLRTSRTRLLPLWVIVGIAPWTWFPEESYYAELKDEFKAIVKEIKNPMSINEECMVFVCDGSSHSLVVLRSYWKTAKRRRYSRQVCVGSFIMLSSLAM